MNKLTLAALQWDKVFTEILAKYADYADVFFLDLAMELSEKTGMNEHLIELIDRKQLSYGPIYTLNLMELETLKIYIKTHLKTGFIQPFKSLADTFILFDKWPDGSLSLCVNYSGLKNRTIKNLYLLPLMSKSLDQLGRAKRFIQLNLMCAYH